MADGAGGGGLLVAIDLQKIFAEPGTEWCTPGFEAVLDPVDRLVEAFSPSVLFTRFVAPQAPEGAWRRYYERYPFALIAPDAPGYELVERFGAHAAGSLETTTFSKWVPAVAGRCPEDGALVVCGVTTDCCVLATALAAADAGVAVRVVADACAGASPASHAAALELLGLLSPLVEVVDLDSALALAAAHSPGRPTGGGEGARIGSREGPSPERR